MRACWKLVPESRDKEMHLDMRLTTIVDISVVKKLASVVSMHRSSQTTLGGKHRGLSRLCADRQATGLTEGSWRVSTQWDSLAIST